MATSPYLLLFKVPSQQPEHRTPTQWRTLTPQSPTCTSSALWIVIYQKFGPVREYSGIRRGDALVGGALRSACRGRSGTRARPLSEHRKWLPARKRPTPSALARVAVCGGVGSLEAGSSSGAVSSGEKEGGGETQSDEGQWVLE